MLFVHYSSAYRKAYKKLFRSGRFPATEVKAVIKLIQQRKVLDLKYLDHELSGDLVGTRECHIRPDLLLLYYIEDNNLVLVSVNLGSHSDLFG